MKRILQKKHANTNAFNWKAKREKIVKHGREYFRMVRQRQCHTVQTDSMGNITEMWQAGRKEQMQGLKQK